MASPDAILHLATLHALAHSGFASTSRAASFTLSSVLSKYLTALATTAVDRATLAGRSKVAATDVVESLEELGVGGIEELYEWTVDTGLGDVFVGAKMDELQGYLREGLSLEEGVEMRFVPMQETIEEESDEDDGEMDVDEDIKPLSLDLSIAPPSPLSWLPLPLPTSTSIAHLPHHPTQPPQTLAERYRRPVPYSTSQLSEARSFDPPTRTPHPPLPPAPSSFPSLLSAFSASEVSIAPRQTEGRRQVADLVRLAVAHPDSFSPPDTLALTLPPPRGTPIVPSHNETYPAHMIPANPSRSTLLASLIHQVRSPYLPPQLRERLTGIRPPIPLKSGQLFGDPVKGPSNAALARARGKPFDPEEEILFRATWDAGPRGHDRYHRPNLPTGKKVIRSVEGEVKPKILEVERQQPMGLKLRIGRQEKQEGGMEAQVKRSAEPMPDSVSQRSPSVKIESL